MSEEEIIIDHLEGMLFFNQRAGRELWFDKPKGLQERDIARAERYLQEAIDYIRTNQQKQGHWIGRFSHKLSSASSNVWVCSECDSLVETAHYAYKCYYKYCPYCGANMEGEEDENE